MIPKAIHAVPKNSSSRGMRVRPAMDGESAEAAPPARHRVDIIVDKLGKNDITEIPAFTDDKMHYLDAFPAAIQNAVRDIAEVSCISEEIVAGQFLHLGSLCINGSRSIVTKGGWVQRANLYLLFVSKSATGKSRSMDNMMEFVNEDEATRKDELKQLTIEYEEKEKEWNELPRKERKELIEKQRHMSDDNPQKYEWPPRKPRDIQYTLCNSTIEAAVESLTDNPSGLTWTIDEFSTFLSGLGRYNKNDGGESVSNIITAYEGGKLKVDRKSKDGKRNGIYEKFGLFAISGNIQPTRLPDLFTLDILERGLPSRFAYVAPETPIQRLGERNITHESRQLLKVLTQKMLEMRINKDEDGIVTFPAPYQLSEKAGTEFAEIYNRIMMEVHDTIYFDFAIRAIARILKIALIIHIFKIVLQKSTIRSTTATQYGVDEAEPKVINTIELATKPFDESVVSAETMHEAVVITNWLTGYTNQVLPEMFPKIYGGGEDKDLQKFNMQKLMNFVTDNPEFCAQPHTITEILKKGLIFKTEEGRNLTQCLGHFFKQLKIHKSHSRAGSVYILSTWTEPK